MTTPTNWPNPKRPGYPMFPERDGWHNFIGHQNVRPDEDDGESPDVSPIYLFCCWWDSELRTWSGFDETPWCIDDCADLLRDEEYHGPALTPTQIAEMLAGERERCAKLLEDAYEKTGKDFEYLGCLSCSDEIRNLGAAP